MVNILDVDFSSLTMDETTDKLDGLLDHSTKPFHVVTANPEIVMSAVKNEEMMSLLKKSDLITPDGIGIVIASRILKTPLTERVAGYDVIHQLLSKREFQNKKTKVFLLGAHQNVIPVAVDKLKELYAHVDVVGYHHGYFKENSTDEEEILKDISKHKPDLLLVGLGSPRQEKFIQKHKETLLFKVAIGCGGTFDVLAGKVKRAPKLFQRLGLEWFYRLLQQPSRVKRQLELPRFLIHVLKKKNG